MSFDNLGLSPKVLEAVTAAGFTEPTPIQEQAIPPAIEGRDVLGLAQTGSGKTAAFTLPMLHRLEKGRARARMPRSLILEPTRELAAQVHEAFETFGKKHRLTVALLIGGVSFDAQDRKLDRGADVLIATPGRLLDHFERGKLLLTGVDIFVVDEADRMLDMGFIPDIERLYKLLPFTRQSLFFSATMPPEIQRITNTFLTNPAKVEVARRSAAAETITQRAVLASRDDATRREALRDVLGEHKDDVKNAIIFANRKTTVGILEKSMLKHGFNAAALHGDMDQHARLRTLESFRDGNVDYLIASDVAARGLDIPDVSHVFNFDVPTHAEDYVHRIGRTGRAGREGFAATMVSPDEFKYFDAIEKLLDAKIEWVDGAPSDEDIAAAKKKRGRGGRASKKDKKETTSAKPEKRRAKKPDDQADSAAREDRKERDDRSERKERKPRRGRDNRNRVYDDVKSMPDATGFGDSEHVPAFLQKTVR
ncbi:MAG: DEAD/DEAH box helicase [Hyphomicrobiales bacterium]